MNVLILSASRKTLLVKAFQDAVRAQGGGMVVAADMVPDSAALQVADRAVLMPGSGDDRFPAALNAICAAFDISLVVPTRDGELACLAELAGDLRGRGIAVLVPAPETVRLCCNSWDFAAFCAENGFQTPLTFTSLAGVDRFPVFCRAADRTAAHPAMRLDSPAALAAYETLHGNVNGGLIVQEFVDWPEYSVDVLMDLTGRPRQAVARRRISMRDGESWKSRVEKLPALTESSLALAELMGLVGHNTLQAFHDPVQGTKFIEVNARFGGASNLSIQAGLASPSRIVQMATGAEADASVPRPVRYGSLLLRHGEDIIIDHDPAGDCILWEDLNGQTGPDR